MYFTLNNMTNSGARWRGQITSVVPESTYYVRQNAFRTGPPLARVLQAKAPPNFYAFRASNAHPVPTHPLVIGLQCVQAEFISAEQLPLNAFPDCTCHARKMLFVQNWHWHLFCRLHLISMRFVHPMPIPSRRVPLCNVLRQNLSLRNNSHSMWLTS